MRQKLLFCLFLLLFPVSVVVGEEAGTNGSEEPGARMAAAMAAAGKDANAPSASESREPEAKMVSGMSILGNKEAPMSLFIVPWKSSELGAETNLTRTLNERMAPVDREVFLRELAFYQVSAGGSGAPQVVNIH